MSEIVDQSLRKITRGALLFAVGTALGMLFSMIGRIVIVRTITQDEWGIYSLGLAIVNLVSIIAVLGMTPGLSRQIAFNRGKAEEVKVRGLVFSSIIIALITGLSVAFLILGGAGFISIKLFHDSGLIIPLRILCIAIPTYVLIDVLSAIFRGFDKVEPSVYFEQILRNGLFLLLLIPVVLLEFQLKGVVYAFAASYVVTLVVFLLYAVKKSPVSMHKTGIEFKVISKELLLFSLPLLAVTMSQSIATRTDTLMIGFFMAAGDVGLYNTALSLVHVIPIALGSVVFISLPLLSQLYAKGQLEDIRKIYASITKWIFSVTLPIFLVLVLFPGATLKIFFGSQYVDASSALVILSIGFFFHSIMGPNGNTLVVMGRTKFYMWVVLLSLVANVALNAILIPILGTNGAAIATMSTLILRNLLLSVRLYLLARINPFTLNYLKPALTSIILALGIRWLVNILITEISLWILPLLFILFVVIYALCVLLTRSFDKEDIMILETIEKKLGINLSGVKKILKRFS